jgi:phage/plasmid-associated DNA primase
MKQVAPRDDVVKFVEDVYGVEQSAVLSVWDRGGIFESQHLKDYMDMLLCQDRLLTESLPLIMGAPLIKYNRRDHDTLEFWLDVPPFNKRHVLYLDSGVVDGNLNLKQFSAIGGPNADSSLAEALIAVGISSKLKYDLEEQVFRSFDGGSGKWERRDDRAWALAQIMREIRKWLKLAIHIQEFHEGRPANTKLLTKYGESARAADEVLKLLRPHISSSFQTPKHLICFSNGLVDLSTGVLLGPAQPEDCVKHSIPHPYDPSVDTTEFQEIMRGFFPPACYGPDAEPIVQFFQRWQGYRLTGETCEQKSLRGRGSNGKSVLANLNAVAFGPEIYHSLSMEAFQHEGVGNNDDLFAAAHARCVDVMENTDNRKINEKLFKSLTGGDGIQVAAKYKTGIKFQPQMKLCFFNNDCPAWSSADCFALSRRCLNLPMRAQFLDADRDTAERARLEEEGHGSWIFDKKATLGEELKALHIPAYLKWCVEGSVNYYRDRLAEPKIIKDVSWEEQKDKVELLEDFVAEYIERCDNNDVRQNDVSLSTEEIREIFLRKEGFLHSLLDKKTEDALNQKLKKLLTGQDMFSGVRAKTLKRYPTRKGLKDVKGYVGVKWKTNIGPLVHAWKQQLIS